MNLLYVVVCYTNTETGPQYEDIIPVIGRQEAQLQFH
jgi:hypothetical protein